MKRPNLLAAFLNGIGSIVLYNPPKYRPFGYRPRKYQDPLWGDWDRLRKDWDRISQKGCK